ncbi:DnaJ domain-containing protein [Chloropicon primus]|uniref:J domain-containing protein n=2 Tax=Chloropicon primus TaxID=1764295 RepID=A0A5B8MVB3_9CHLO|nr:hypothetical protein A3770_11p62020 [Chloropicon primus]UPR02897.1 DnaJ domain-containing protein [Chloropicon primus]|eukprot:QDZ23684.1 hypothetical protein A3770_11p62020 [Chloropicon primus]
MATTKMEEEGMMRRGGGGRESEGPSAVVEASSSSSPSPAPKVRYSKASEDDLGKVWRCEKVRDFEWRMRCLGLEDNAEAVDLLKRMLRSTEELNEIGDAMSRGEVEPKWWLGGDYDADEAEEHNDEGAALFKGKEYGEAFESFTRAIARWPSRAVYHANRASAALKVGDFEVAASDCGEALRLDPGNAKVMARRAAALGRLGRFAEAAEVWSDVLEADPGSVKARAGLATSRSGERAARARRQEELERSEAGGRTGLPLRGVADDWSDRLYSLTEMLKYEGGLSANLSVVEALIMCRRYPDALGRLEAMPATTETRYLTAEAKWRSGHVRAAVEVLGTSLPRTVDKCAALSKYLGEVGDLLGGAREALEDERCVDAIEACEALERVLDPEACSGLFALVAEIKASSLMFRGQAKEAAGVLDSALVLEPESQPCLLLRARARQKIADHHGALADLSLLQSINPSAPGVFAMMQRLARTLLESKNPSYKIESVRKRTGFDPYAVLGIGPGATDPDIRKAYRKLAGQWHPDKWLQKTEDQRVVAGKRFEEIQKAYESLTIAEEV